MRWVISDVHGCYYTLRKLIDRVHAVDSRYQLIFVGDYVDRGLFSRRTVDYLIDLQKDGAICLRGNHDDVMDEICNGQSLSVEEENGHKPTLGEIIIWWALNGIHTTLDDYGVRQHRQNQPCSAEEIGREFQDKIPQSHKDFFRNLQVWWESSTHFACHAYLNPLSTKFIDCEVAELMWSRFDLKQFPIWDRIGVFGHTPVFNYGAVAPIVFGQLRLIDTCAFSDGYLCAYNCDNDDHILQATDRRDIGGDDPTKRRQVTEDIGLQLKVLLRQNEI